MGCTSGKMYNPNTELTQTTEREYIEGIFDYMTSDPDLTESCVLAISEKMKQISLYELQTHLKIMKDRYDRVIKSNAVDLFLIAVTDDKGNITYKRFRKFISEMRLRPEHYKDLMERMKQIKLHRGCGHSSLRCRSKMEPVYIGDISRLSGHSNNKCNQVCQQPESQSDNTQKDLIFDDPVELDVPDFIN